MASRGEIGWQSQKTLAECMRYMLDNEIATDVCFEVGPPDGATVNIRAHKLMLISRSPVFEAMFSSDMFETKSISEAKIRIVDIKEEVFKLLLSFIYCDSVSVELGSAPKLLYAAQKYLLPRLTEFCSKYLHSILNTNNVCGILELSLTFDVEDLKIQCLRLIADHSETVLNGKELLTLSRESLEAILKVDRITSGPTTLFHSCVKWAKHRLQIEQSMEAPTDLQIRKTLGSLLYEIPFPTISVTEFAHLVGESDVLTAKEKSAVYYYLGSRKGIDKLKFSTENRHEHLVHRVTKTTKGLWPHSQCSACGNNKKSTYEISFKTDRNILLTGLGLYAGHSGSNYEVDIQISQEKDSLLQEKRIVPYTGSSTTFKFSFDEPVSIAQGKLYSISALAFEAIGYYGELCPEIHVENVTFTFVPVLGKTSDMCTLYSCSHCGVLSTTQRCNRCGTNFGCFGGNVSAATYGQIPQLYFIPL